MASQRLQTVATVRTVEVDVGLLEQVQHGNVGVVGEVRRARVQRLNVTDDFDVLKFATFLKRNET